MITQEEVTSTASRCLEVAGAIKRHKKYNVDYSGAFPSQEELKLPQSHLAFIVEQLEEVAEKLLSNQLWPEYLGVSTEIADLMGLAEIILSEICEFQVEWRDLNVIRQYTMGQTVIPGYTFVNHARSASLPHTYKFLDMPDQKRVLEQFSVPFYIRIAIEQKLRSMTGFKSFATTRRGKTYNDERLPVGPLLRFLEARGSEFFSLDLSVKDLKNIYAWSCNFVHAGRKEYRWLLLKATGLMVKFFANHEGSAMRIRTLIPGKALNDLEVALNEFSNTHRKSTAVTYSWTLSEDVYDMQHLVFDSRKYFMGPPER
ncbi:hypothetical protein ACF8Q9_08155 [Pseudomonas sp. TYF_15]|uniref:hypothetical protein n=1 Tax=Pseudomonas sp. TYF_15 TaxID=3367194 RepID=UPI00370C8E96